MHVLSRFGRISRVYTCKSPYTFPAQKTCARQPCAPTNLWEPTQDSLLPCQAQRELDLAWVARSARSLAGDGLNRVADIPKACTAGASTRQCELGPVEKIEHLGSKLGEVQTWRFFMNPYIIWSIMQLVCSGVRPSEIYSRLLKCSLAFSPPNRRKSHASRRKPTRTSTRGKLNSGMPWHLPPC